MQGTRLDAARRAKTATQPSCSVKERFFCRCLLCRAPAPAATGQAAALADCGKFIVDLLDIHSPPARVFRQGLAHIVRSSLLPRLSSSALFGALHGLAIPEPHALVLARLLLFAVLADIVLATRKIDWCKLAAPAAAS